jgi:excisionase family DNA binding protein
MDMTGSSKPLYVRLRSADADRLSAVAASTGKSKRQLVTEAVRAHLDDPGPPLGRVAFREAPAEVITLEEAARLLRLDEQAVEESARRGDLPARRIGGDWRFSRSAVLAWLAGEPSPGR